jgi:hypothetical protein
LRFVGWFSRQTPTRPLVFQQAVTLCENKNVGLDLLSRPRQFLARILPHPPNVVVLTPKVSPLEEQKKDSLKISEKLDASQNIIDSLESQLAEINRLPAPLLREAFAGAA